MKDDFLNPFPILNLLPQEMLLLIINSIGLKDQLNLRLVNENITNIYNEQQKLLIVNKSINFIKLNSFDFIVSQIVFKHSITQQDSDLIKKLFKSGIVITHNAYALINLLNIKHWYSKPDFLNTLNLQVRFLTTFSTIPSFEILINAGASLNVRDANGLTLIEGLAKRFELNNLQILLKLAAHNPVITTHIIKNDIDVAEKQFLITPTLNQSSHINIIVGQKYLLDALEKDNPTRIQELISKGVNFTKRNLLDAKPLCRTVLDAQNTINDALINAPSLTHVIDALDAGAQINAINNVEDTKLCISLMPYASNRKLEMAEYLINRGAIHYDRKQIYIDKSKSLTALEVLNLRKREVPWRKGLNISSVVRGAIALLYLIWKSGNRSAAYIYFNTFCGEVLTTVIDLHPNCDKYVPYTPIITCAINLSIADNSDFVVLGLHAITIGYLMYNFPEKYFIQRH